MSVMLYPCMFSVVRLMDVCFVCCVFVHCLVKQFAICLGCVCYFVVECYGLDTCCWRCSIG